MSVKYFNRADFLLGEPVLIEKFTVASTALDAGNTLEGTHILRAGLVVGKITASGKLAQYAAGASDGTETAVGVLLNDVDLKNGDPLASAADRVAYIAKIARVKESGLIGLDAAGKADLINGGGGAAWFVFE